MPQSMSSDYADSYHTSQQLGELWGALHMKLTYGCKDISFLHNLELTGSFLLRQMDFSGHLRKILVVNAKNLYKEREC